MIEATYPPPKPGRGWLTVSAVGGILMVLGALLHAGARYLTRANMRAILAETGGNIRSDEQMMVLNDVMTRGLMLNIGSAGAVVVGLILVLAGLAGYYGVRRRS